MSADGANVHHTVLQADQGVPGSPGSVVASTMETVCVNGRLVTLVASSKLSFVGGAAELVGATVRPTTTSASSAVMYLERLMAGTPLFGRVVRSIRRHGWCAAPLKIHSRRVLGATRCSA
jgi:hypothetical protein